MPKYSFTVIVVQDAELDIKKVINKLMDATSKVADSDAGIVIGPSDPSGEEFMEGIVMVGHGDSTS